MRRRENLDATRGRRHKQGIKNSVCCRRGFRISSARILLHIHSGVLFNIESTKQGGQLIVDWLERIHKISDVQGLKLGCPNFHSLPLHL
jgi:hypothetical protein